MLHHIAGVFVPFMRKTRVFMAMRARTQCSSGVEISPLAVRDFFTENSLKSSIFQEDNFYRWESDGLIILQGDFFNVNRGQVQDVECVF